MPTFKDIIILLLVMIIMFFVINLDEVKAEPFFAVPKGASTNDTIQSTINSVHNEYGLFYQLIPGKLEDIRLVSISYDLSNYTNYKYISFLLDTWVLGTPLVTIDNVPCEVVSSSYAYDNGNDSKSELNGNIHGVVCSQFKANSILKINYSDIRNSSETNFGYTYVSQVFNAYGSNEYSSAIKEVNDSVNKVNDSINKVGDKVGEVGDAVNDVNDTLNDGSVDSDAIGAIGSNLPETVGVLSSIINLPIRFFQVLLNALNTTTCPVISFKLPFVGNQVTIPCVRNLLDQIGALDFYETIGTMVGGLLMFKYTIFLGKTFQKMSDLESTNNQTWGGL